MQSISKAPVSRHAAQRIVHHHFGTQRTIRGYEELKDGYFNASWKITLDDGFDCVLKVAPCDDVRVLTYEHGIMSAEVSVMQRVQSETEMPVPDIFYHDTRRLVIPNEYYLMAFVPGISLQAARQQDPGGDYREIEQELGRLLAQMNAITGQAFGYATPEATRYRDWRTAFESMVDGVLADGESMGVELPLPYARVRERMQRAYPALEEVVVPQLVHWDLWDGNIFIDPAARRLTGIIDFERAMWADPLIEQNFIDLPEKAPFLTGYGKVMPATPGERTRRTLYNAYLFLIMVIEHYYRRYPTNELETYGRHQLTRAFDALGQAR